MSTKTQVVHFSVEPGFYDQHARGLMLEDNWRGALSFLMDTLQGMTYDLAVGVLQGKLSIKVDADGDLATCEQDPTDEAYLRYRGTYDWQHAGLWQIGAEFYQPYAVVERFGFEDQQYAREELQRWEDRDYTPAEYRTLRARYYAEHRETDLVHFDNKLGAVLFKRIAGPAFWQASHKEPAAAIAAFLKLRRLSSLKAEPLRDTQATDFRHWKFYESALYLGKLRMSRWDETLLTPAILDTLTTLVEVADNVQIARWDEEAKKAGLPVEAEEDDEDDRDEKGRPRRKEKWTYAQWQSRLTSALLRAEIREKAAKSGGFIQLVLKDRDDGESTVVVPAAALLRWCSRNIRGARWDDIPAWTTVSPSGMKGLSDDPVHTDWWIGAGFEPREAYHEEHPLYKAAWNFSVNLSFTYGQDFVKLAGKGRAFGRVVFPKPNEAVPEGSIAVVPFAGVDYEIAMLSACKKGRGAVIAQVGGKLAHLATVARETEARVLVVDNAMNVFRAGEFVLLDMDNMTLQRHRSVFNKDDDFGDKY